MRRRTQYGRRDRGEDPAQQHRDINLMGGADERGGIASLHLYINDLASLGLQTPAESCTF